MKPNDEANWVQIVNDKITGVFTQEEMISQFQKVNQEIEIEGASEGQENESEDSDGNEIPDEELSVKSTMY